jgi:hypothetical protein
VFVPENIPPGDYTVELGLYVPSGKNERFALNAKRISERSYDVGHFNIRAARPEELGDFVEGWYDLEREPGNPWEHWRWTSGKAVFRAQNPHADAILYLKADTDRSRFADPQQVVVLMGSKEIDRFEMQSNEPLVRKTTVRASELGSTNTVEFTVQVNPTFQPGGSDSRSLGIRVYCLYLGKVKE